MKWLTRYICQTPYPSIYSFVLQSESQSQSFTLTFTVLYAVNSEVGYYILSFRLHLASLENISD